MRLLVPIGASPQATFKFIEQGFFGIRDEDWPTAILRRINELTNNYTNEKHRLHVLALNRGFDPFPPIDVSHFNVETQLIRLFRDIIEPRLRHTFTGFTELEVDPVEMELPEEEVESLAARMESFHG